MHQHNTNRIEPESVSELFLEHLETERELGTTARGNASYSFHGMWLMWNNIKHMELDISKDCLRNLRGTLRLTYLFISYCCFVNNGYNNRSLIAHLWHNIKVSLISVRNSCSLLAIFLVSVISINDTPREWILFQIGNYANVTRPALLHSFFKVRISDKMERYGICKLL
jgi:hypothetical protein